MQLSIIIVNYNVKYFLEQCLHSVHKAIEGIKAEVFVVDNNSSDGSREYLTGKFSWVNFKWNTTNEGFGKASNSVLNEANGDHILFLNPDTIVPEDCFKKCLSFIMENKNCGALGVQMIDGSGRFLKESKRGFPSPMNSFNKMVGFTALFPSSKIFAGYYAGHLPQNKNNEVEVLAGAFMMLTKKAVNATAGFDEAFFMYGEDVDLSYRIRQAGMKNYYFADTTILHFKGESTQKLSVVYVKHFYGAMLLFIKKHYGERKIHVFFMNMAIGFSKGLALAKMRMNKNEDVISMLKPAITVVLAGQQKFNECLTIIKHASPPVLLAGRIAISKNDRDASIGNLDDIKNPIKKNKIDQLLICEGEITFQNIIQLTKNISGKINFLFHAQGSKSIVGSSNKNVKGIFIAIP